MSRLSSRDVEEPTYDYGDEKRQCVSFSLKEDLFLGDRDRCDRLAKRGSDFCDIHCDMMKPAYHDYKVACLKQDAAEEKGIDEQKPLKQQYETAIRIHTLAQNCKNKRIEFQKKWVHPTERDVAHDRRIKIVNESVEQYEREMTRLRILLQRETAENRVKEEMTRVRLERQRLADEELHRVRREREQKVSQERARELNAQAQQRRIEQQQAQERKATDSELLLDATLEGLIIGGSNKYHDFNEQRKADMRKLSGAAFREIYCPRDHLILLDKAVLEVDRHAKKHFVTPLGYMYGSMALLFKSFWYLQNPNESLRSYTVQQGFFAVVRLVMKAKDFMEELHVAGYRQSDADWLLRVGLMKMYQVLLPEEKKVVLDVAHGLSRKANQPTWKKWQVDALAFQEFVKATYEFHVAQTTLSQLLDIPRTVMTTLYDTCEMTGTLKPLFRITRPLDGV